MTSLKRARDEAPILTTRDFRVVGVAVMLGLIALGALGAKRLGYWPGAAVTVETVSAKSEPLDINRAQWWELATLPGIGETRARAIVKMREEHGPFRSVEELSKVPGIPKPVLAGMKGLVQVGEISGETRE